MTIQIRSSSQLTHAFAAASPVSQHGSIAVAHDAAGRLTVVTLGSDGRLYHFAQGDGPAGTWTQTELTAGLPASLSFADLSLAEAGPGNLLLAARAVDAGDPSTGLLFTRTSLTDGAWRQLGARGPGVAIERLAAGFLADGTAKLVVTTRAVGAATCDLIDVGLGATPTWHPLPNHPDLIAVGQLAIGEVSTLFAGVYLAFTDAAGARHGGFASFPSATITQSNFRHLPVGDGLRGLTAVLAHGGAAGASIVYFASDTVYRMDPGQQMSWKSEDQRNAVALGGPPLGQVDALVARNTPDGGQRLWALTGDGVLHFCPVDASGTPGALFALRTGVAELAVLESRTPGLFELAVVDSDGTLHHLFQDPVTTRWSQQLIATHAIGPLLQSTALATRLVVRDEGGRLLAGAAVELLASERLVAEVNGASQALSPDVPCPVTTDGTGGLTVLYRLSTTDGKPASGRVALGAPAYRLTVGGATTTVTTSDAMATRLSALTVASLRASSPRTGKPYVDPSVPDATVAAALTTVQQFLADSQGLPSAFAPAVARSAPVERGPVRSLPRLTAANAPALVGSLDGLVHDVGDVLEAAAHGLIQAGQIAFQRIGDTIELALDSALKVIVRFAEQAWAAIGWLFDHGLGLALDALAELLGQLLDWPAVQRTHAVLVNLCDQSLAMIQAQLAAVQRVTDQALDGLQARLANLAPSPAPAASLSLQSLGTPAWTSGGGDLMSKATELVTDALDNAVVQMTLGQLSPVPLFRAIANTLGPTDAGLFAPLVDAITRGVGSEATAILTDLLQSGSALATLFDAPGGLTVNGVLTTLAQLGADQLRLLISSARNLIDTLLSAVAALFQIVQHVLDADIDLPVIGALYRRYLSASGKASALDLLTLGLALPLTELWRVVTGHAPFDDAASQGAASASWQVLFPAFARLDGTLQASPALASPMLLGEPAWLEVIDIVRGGASALLNMATGVTQFMVAVGADAKDAWASGPVGGGIKWGLFGAGALSWLLSVPVRAPDGGLAWGVLGVDIAMWITGLVDLLLGAIDAWVTGSGGNAVGDAIVAVGALLPATARLLGTVAILVMESIEAAQQDWTLGAVVDLACRTAENVAANGGVWLSGLGFLGDKLATLLAEVPQVSVWLKPLSRGLQLGGPTIIGFSAVSALVRAMVDAVAQVETVYRRF